MKNYFSNIKEKLISILFLDKTSWLLLILALIGNLILWYIWLFKIHFSRNPMFFSFFALILNIGLSFLSFRKEPLISYFLLGTALLIQILMLILIKYSLNFGY